MIRPALGTVLLASLGLSSSAAAPLDSSARAVRVPGRAAVDSTVVIPNDNRTAAGQLNSGVLTLRLAVRSAGWRPEGPQGPELRVHAFAEENGAPRIPGPLIRVPLGTEIRATIRNALVEPLRLYGFQERPASALDSVVVAPGASAQLRMRAGAPGTYLYWARTTRDTFPIGQLEDGLLSGAIVVDSAGAGLIARMDRVFVIGLWKAEETPPGTPVHLREETLVFNGLAWPHSERLTHAVGDTVRWRVINATRRGHPLHLHGFHYRIDARGTALSDTIYAPAAQRLAVTERLAPLNTMALTWSPHTAGNWLFHCHLVEHISARVKPNAHQMPGASHQNHALDEMAGLVLGITVRARNDIPVAPVAAARRTLRLFVTERARVYDERSAYSFVLQQGAGVPAQDSLQLPAPPLVLTRGEPVAITVLNRAHTPVAVHWHGIELESYYDGVSGWSGAGNRLAPQIAPGDSFVVRMSPPRAGTFIYHTHHDEVSQMGAGLFGPLLVLEPGQARDTLTDRIFLMGSAGPQPGAPPSLNGETTPKPIELRSGANYRFRFISIGPYDNKAIRLVSDTVLQRWRAVAKDGADLPPQQATVRPARLVMGTGETADFEFTSSTSQDLTLEIVSFGRVALPPVLTRVPVRVRN